MKIAILTFCIGKEFQRQTAAGVKSTTQYCDKHGYDYLVKHELPTPRTDDKPIAWYKLLSIAEELPNYDWVFWLDSDTHIMDQKIKLESWLINRKPSTDFVFSTDPVCEVNSGVFFIRNTQTAIDALYRWYNGPVANKWWEQYAVNNLLHTCNYEVDDRLSGILRFRCRIPTERFYRTDYNWISHAAGRNKKGEDITNRMESYYSKIRG